MTENGQGMKYSHLKEGKGTEWTRVGLSKRNIAIARSNAQPLISLLPLRPFRTRQSPIRKPIGDPTSLESS